MSNLNISGYFNDLPVFNKTENFADPIINDGILSWEKVHVSSTKFETHLVLKCPSTEIEEIVYDGFGQQFIGQRVMEIKTSLELGDKVFGNYNSKGSWYEGVISRVHNTNTYDISYTNSDVVEQQVNRRFIHGDFYSGFLSFK